MTRHALVNFARRLLVNLGSPLTIKRREELGGCFGWLCGVRTMADSVVLQASSLGATGVRVRLLGVLNSGVKVASVAGAVPHAHSGDL